MFGDDFDNLFRRVRERIRRGEGDSAFGEHLSAELDICALEPYDERKLEPDVLDRGDDAGRYDIAPHDSAEYVDQNPLYVRVFEEDVESLRDGLFGRAAANVEEVCGIAAEVLIISIVAIASPAPFTMHAMLPSSAM